GDNNETPFAATIPLQNGVASVEPFFSRHQTDYSRAPVFTAFFFSFLRSLGILVTGVTLNVGFGAVIFTYAIMVGYGIGASYGLLLSVAASWFPKHRGLIVGICACGFGAGAIILTPIQTYIINPGNIAVNNVTQMFEDEAMLDRVPKCLYIIGGIMAGFQLIGCIFAHPRPEKSDSVIEGTSEETPEDVLGRPQLKTVVAPDEEVSLTPSQVMRESNIFIFWTIMFLSLVPLTLITASLKVVGQISIPDDKYLSTVNTIGAVFNTLARIAWGPVGDVFSYKMPLCCLNVFYGFILVTLPYIPSIPGAGKQLYAIWVILTFICIAGNFVLLPFGISRAFGHKYFAANYGIVFSAFTPGSITGALIVYFVKLEYCLKEIFIACGIICLCSAIAALFLTDKQAPKWCQVISCDWRKRNQGDRQAAHDR
uniref:Oxalate:formate antiporter n=1 Tax=Mesocestoides corti TaxID=53468 RepID=A0A5K3FB10_MESCO